MPPKVGLPSLICKQHARKLSPRSTQLVAPQYSHLSAVYTHDFECFTCAYSRLPIVIPPESDMAGGDGGSNSGAAAEHVKELVVR